ncbi:MAG TPA: hypothetical protein VFP95_06000, partial [Gammaproteobacteria bacterium]|nr:hypothetical protein [Gammaproteobacteria bacterium]
MPSQPPVDSSAVQPPTLDSIAVKGAQHYALIPGQSDVRVRVYRAGALASLGHNHIISTTSVS